MLSADVIDSTVVFCRFELDQLVIMATLDLQSSCQCTLPSVTAKQSASLWWNCRTQKISQPADASVSSPQTTTNWPLTLASGQHGKVRTVRPDLFANGIAFESDMAWFSRERGRFVFSYFHRR